MHMIFPKVSVIIPTYNRYPLVCRAIDSVLAQTYGHCECLVVDDGSTEGTMKSLEGRYGTKIVVWRNERNRDKSFSRNAGILASTGDYLAFLDSDDVLTSDSVEKRMSLFLDDASFQGVSFGLRLGAHEEEASLALRLTMIPRGEQLSVEQYMDYPKWLSTNSYLVQRDMMVEHGMYNEALANGEDVELFLRLFAALEFRCCGTVVTRIYGDAPNRARDNAASIIARGHILSRLLEANPLIVAKFAFAIQQIKQREYARLLKAYYRVGQYENFRMKFVAGWRNGLTPHTAWFCKRYLYSWCQDFLRRN